MDRANQLVTVFGGSGFIGTQLVQQLARAGYRIRVAVRRPDLAGHVKPLGNVGQVVPIQANIRNADSVMRAVADYACANAGQLLELDVNPLLVNAQGATAVDALIRLGDEHAR